MPKSNIHTYLNSITYYHCYTFFQFRVTPHIFNFIPASLLCYLGFSPVLKNIYYPFATSRLISFGNNFSGKKTLSEAHRFCAFVRIACDNNLQFDRDKQCNARQHSRRRKILVCTAARNFCGCKYSGGDFIFKLRLSRTAAVWKAALHF